MELASLGEAEGNTKESEGAEMIGEILDLVSDDVITKETAVDDAKAHVMQCELELEYAKTQLAKIEQEKKDVEKLCKTWNDMTMMTRARKMNASPAFGGAPPPQSGAGGAAPAHPSAGARDCEK